jgi:hypothetical protein
VSPTQQALDAIACTMAAMAGEPSRAAAKAYESEALAVLDALLALPRDVRVAALGIRGGSDG